MNATVMISSIAFFSGLVRSIIGFTTGTLSLALLSLLLPFDQALVTSALMNVINNTLVWLAHHHALDRNIAVHFGIPAVIFAIIGSLLFVLVGFGPMPFVLGCTLVIYALVMFALPEPIVIKDRPALALFGAISGFFKGFMGIGLGIRTAAFMALGVSKQTYLATGCFISALVDALRLAVYRVNGISITALTLWQIIWVALLLFMGTFIGNRILWRVSERTYRTMIFALIFAVGVSLLVREMLSTQCAYFLCLFDN